MSKSVMISIKPRYCELIALGLKTVEVRKTRPNLETPFKCYIYETTDKNYENRGFYYPKAPLYKIFVHHTGKVIGEFICDAIYSVWAGYTANNGDDCLSFDERETYLGSNMGFGWHISDLKIYDKPKELRDFIRPSGGCCNEGKCTGCRFFRKGNGYNLEDDCYADFDTDEYSILKHPPQSWCYVEEIE